MNKYMEHKIISILSCFSIRSFPIGLIRKVLFVCDDKSVVACVCVCVCFLLVLTTIVRVCTRSVSFALNSVPLQYENIQQTSNSRNKGVEMRMSAASCCNELCYASFCIFILKLNFSCPSRRA